MDGPQFDDLTRFLGRQGPSRRRLVGLLAGGLLTGTFGPSTVSARPTRKKDPCATSACFSCRTCGRTPGGTLICKDFLDRTSCGGCNTVCGADQDCCSGTCRTRGTIDNCEGCSACPAGGDWFCNPTLYDSDGDGVSDTPGCDCLTNNCPLG